MKFLVCTLLGLLPLGCLSAPQTSKGGRQLERLFHSLFDEYDKDVRPINEDGKPVDVKFGVAPICFDLTSDGILKSELWLRWVWNDARLKAKTDIKAIRVNPAKLWKPDVTLYNRADTWKSQFPDGSDMSKALVYPANGEVLWVPNVFHEARCDTDLDDLWGEQTCTLKFGSWTYDGYILDVDFYGDKKGVDVDNYAANCPTKVLSSTAVKEVKRYPCCEEPYPSLLFNVTLQRQYVVTEHGVLRNPRMPIASVDVIV